MTPNSDTHAGDNPVLQLRLIVEADDYEQALAFYRDALGLPEQVAFQGDGDAKVAILHAGRATLEIANSAQKALIDEHEVGRPVSPKIRVAFEVADAGAVTNTLTTAGADLIAAPTITPWRSRNARLQAPQACRSRYSKSSRHSTTAPPRTGSAPPGPAPKHHEMRHYDDAPVDSRL